MSCIEGQWNDDTSNGTSCLIPRGTTHSIKTIKFKCIFFLMKSIFL